ncbi:MAG: S9 family peptidase [Planctomycetes bacterium]|nr:S9 family peptidase [Planctomycetota bacterium]
MNRSLARPTLVALLAVLMQSTTACIAAPRRASGDKELTVDRIYSEPSLSGSLVSGITWLPDGSGYVFVDKEDAPAPASGEKPKPRSLLRKVDVATGERSTWVSADDYAKAFENATVGEQRPSGRAGFGGFSITPDGKRLLLPVSGDLYVYDVESKSLRQITASKSNESNSSMSPDGTKVAYVRDWNLYAFDLTKGLEIQLTSGGTEEHRNGTTDWVYDEELSLSTGNWWSPDSTHLAYLQFDETPVPQIPIVDFIPLHKEIEWERYPKAGDPNPIVKLGVVSIADAKTTWIDTPGAADGYIARVSWSPDGASLLVQVLNRKQTTLTLLKADPKTGTSQPLFVETTTGWIDVSFDTRVLADGRILWSSERNGFDHLYLYSADGRDARTLTSGSWNVESVAGIDEEGGWVYFTSDEKSPLETHLCRAHLDGSGREQLTKEAGTHSITMPKNAKAYLDTWSTVTHPSRRELHRADGSLVKVVEENPCDELAQFRLGTAEFVTFKTSDGVELQGQWVKPPDFDAARRYPVLVYVYGGPLSQVVRNSWGGPRYLWSHVLAQKGLLVFSMDNRAANPHGLGIAATIYRRLGEVELSDELEAVKYLHDQPFVDGDHIGIWGWSYGGYMAAYSILNAPQAFAAAIAVAPVTDWRNYDSIYTERYMDLPQDNPDGYKKTAPVTAAKNLAGKFLLVHGTADDNVHFQNSVQLTSALEKEGKQFRFMMYPGGRHGMGGNDIQKQLFTMMTDFIVSALHAHAPSPAPTNASAPASSGVGH